VEHASEIKVKAGQMIAEGVPKKEVAKRLDVPYRTLMSWVMQGDRLVVGGDPMRGHEVMNSAMRGDLDGAAASRTATGGGSVEGVADPATVDREAIAREAGLDPRLASRLVGSTREELLADARALAAAIPNRAPVPGLGIRGEPIAGTPSMNDLIRAAAGRVVIG
jgi:hypothetical protein